MNKAERGQSLIKNSACTHTILIDLGILCIFIGSAGNLETKYYMYNIHKYIMAEASAESQGLQIHLFI